MEARIASELLRAIGDAAEASPDEEVCGLLLCSRDSGVPADAGVQQVTAVLPCRNVAADPRHRFEIDPVVLLAAHRAARGGGPAIVGCYHSHPSGLPIPSARDAADAAPDGRLWLIAAGGEVRAWRAVSDGSVHGRFEPVALACAKAAASPQRPLSTKEG